MSTQPRCNLIIDSCCDLPFDAIDVEGVTLLRFPYLTSEGEKLDDLFETVSAHDFYEGMRNGEQPSTAQIPIGVFAEVFENAARSGVPTVYLSFTSGLSGSFETANLVCEQMRANYPEAELYVVDTCLASIAEGLLVYEALRERSRGLSATEMVRWAEEARYFVNELFMVDGLDSLSRGGRIPPSVAFAGSKLDVKPMLDIALDGKLSLVSVARGRRKGIKQLAEFYCKRVEAAPEERRRVVIGHSDCPKDVERLKDELRKFDETLVFLEMNIGPVIGSHVGPGMLAISFWGTDSREALSISERIASRINHSR